MWAFDNVYVQGDMVAISQKSSLDDEDSTVIEGVVIDQARRFVTFAPSFLFPVPFKQLCHMNFSVTYASWAMEFGPSITFEPAVSLSSQPGV